MPTGLTRRALRLSWLTVLYNIAEGVVSILLGMRAGSAALIGFGLDSFVESLSGGIMVWRFTAREMSEEDEQRLERRAVRLVGWTFLILGLYVLYESLSKIFGREAPEVSLGGIILAVVSLIIMPWLARAKRRTGEALGSEALLGDSKETLACAWLSVALLLGLGLNALFGLWWADPAAGLVIVFFLLREGIEMAWGEECGGCCSCGDEE
jgi:divalent metal cation (Fe/Co/Zn/Cd) transporter